MADHNEMNQQKLAYFQEITGVKDASLSHQILDAYGWDLDSAFQATVDQTSNVMPEYEESMRDNNNNNSNNSNVTDHAVPPQQPDTDRAQGLDDEMLEAFVKCLQMDYYGALKHLDTAVNNNRQSVDALRFRALLKHLDGRKNGAFEDKVYAAHEHSNFVRAMREEKYPFTQTSRHVIERILCFLTPIQLRQSPLTGIVIEVRDEQRIPASAYTVASALPAFFTIEQIDFTICNQIFHAAATFTPSLSWTGVESNEVALTLRLTSVEFGVHGCLGGNTDDSNGDAGSKGKINLLGYVVYRLQVQTSPGELWRSDSKLCEVRPGDEHNIHPVQHTGTTGFTAAANVSPIAIPSATIQGNYSDGVTTTSSTHGFIKSSRGMTASGKHQEWISVWQLNSYKCGKKFSLDSCVGSKIPELPVSDPGQVNYPTLNGHEATWMVPLDVAMRLNYKFDVEISIQANVALVPRWRKRDRVTSPFSPPVPFKDTVRFAKVIHCEFLDSVEKRVIAS